MSRFENSEQDRNFDDLAERFSRNIYAGLKGRIRLEVLRRDLHEFVLGNTDPLHILDAGAGQGQFALELAGLGHSVVLNDISSEMLAHAREKINSLQDGEVAGRTRLIQQPLQSLHEVFPPGQQFDGVLSHAVIEWLAEPQTLFDSLLPLLKSGGWLSLLFYNFHGLEFKNLLRANFARFNPSNFKPARGSLTPIHPHTPERIRQWLDEYGLELICASGVRVIHDYILDPRRREQEPDMLLQKELEYSRKEPYWRLGRYIHFLCRKP